jgi:hypothetical protein
MPVRAAPVFQSSPTLAPRSKFKIQNSYSKSMSTVIKVENVSKLYRLGEIGTGSIAHDVNHWWHRCPLGAMLNVE